MCVYVLCVSVYVCVHVCVFFLFYKKVIHLFRFSISVLWPEASEQSFVPDFKSQVSSFTLLRGVLI